MKAALDCARADAKSAGNLVSAPVEIVAEYHHSSCVYRQLFDGAIEVGIAHADLHRTLRECIGENLTLALADPGAGPIESYAICPTGLIVEALN
jgi:hypothetical protein